jgi:TolB-like protein
MRGLAKLLLLFDDLALDCERRELRRGAALVAVEPKVFDFLVYLVQNRERVLTRDELITSVWKGRIVSESALASCISAARAAIGDSGERQRLIKTLPRKGVRFVGAVGENAPGDFKPRAMESLPDGRSHPPSILDRPSIAVLPFQNISSDPEQEYFADGMVEDIISGLSRIKWLFVIARNSSFVYKGNATDVKQVGRELGVRYVLEGSVRRAGNRVRITAQLNDAETGIQIWSERYDRLFDDIFAVQDELAMSVIGAIEPSLRKIEIERVKRKRPDSLDAYDFILRALPFTYSHRAEDADTAIPLLSRALELEPGYAAAHAPLALCHHSRFRFGLREEDRVAAVHHARSAIATGNDDATALGIAGFVISLDDHDNVTALDVFERALTLSNSNIFALLCSALVLSFMGQTETAIERAERALRLSPFDPLNYLAYNALAISYFTTGRYEQSHDATRRSIQINPRFSVCHLFHTAALVGLARNEEAKSAAKRVLAFHPTFTISGFSITVGFEPKVFALLADAWRVAGLPES